MPFQDVKHVGLQERTVVGAILVVGSQMGGTQFSLGLRLEDRFLNPHTECAHQPLPDVLRRELLLVVELLHHAGIPLAEGALVRAALGCVLPIDEGIIVVAVLTVDMGESSLKILVLDMDDGVQRLAFHVVLQQVQQSVLRIVSALVIVEGQPPIQIAIIPHSTLHILADEMEVTEQLRVRHKFYQRPRALWSVGQREVQDSSIRGQLPFGKLGDARLPLTERLHTEPTAQRVHRLGTHAIQSYRLLEYLTVVLGSRIQLADGIHHLTQRYATPVVADTHLALAKVDGHVNPAAKPRRELIDSVVYYLLDEDIDAVVVRRAIAQLADIHTRTQPDVFHVFKMNDTVVVVIDCLVGHRDVVFFHD